MEARPYAPNERVVVAFGPSFVPARIVAVGKKNIDIVCDGGDTVRTVSALSVFRPGPELDRLIAKRAESGVDAWDLTPLLKAIYERHPHVANR